MPSRTLTDSAYLEVTNVEIKKQPDGTSRGFAFVTFAEKAMRNRQDSLVCGNCGPPDPKDQRKKAPVIHHKVDRKACWQTFSYTRVSFEECHVLGTGPDRPAPAWLVACWLSRFPFESVRDRVPAS